MDRPVGDREGANDKMEHLSVGEELAELQAQKVARERIRHLEEELELLDSDIRNEEQRAEDLEAREFMDGSGD